MSKEIPETVNQQDSISKNSELETGEKSTISQSSEKFSKSFELNYPNGELDTFPMKDLEPTSLDELLNRELNEQPLSFGKFGFETEQRSNGDIDKAKEVTIEEPIVSFVNSDPPFKKNRRIQVPSNDITKGISSIEPSPKKPIKKRLHDPTPQKIGVLVGVPCRRRPSKGGSDENQQQDLLKHFTLVFLFSRLKNPMKWDVATFEEIQALGNSIDSTMVNTKFCVQYKDLDHSITLTSTLAKGRINSTDAPPPTLKSALIEHVSSYSGLVLKCESHYMMLWRITEGYYLYDPCLNDVSQLIFFNSLKLLMKFILEKKQLNDRSKFYMAKISWHAVDDGLVMTLKRMSRIAKKFKILNSKEALLMGDRYIKDAGFKLESLRVSLNAIYLAQQLEARSWDASNLNGLFNGLMSDKEINKLGVFLIEEGEEESFLLEKGRLIRLSVSFHYTQREDFEWLVNRLITIRVALIIRVNESYFSVWSSGNILYWFSPFRYDALKLDPVELEDKASFMYAFNTLDRLSTVMFEYLTEIGLLPKHCIRMFTVDGEPFGKAPRLPLVDSKDSLNRSELEIQVSEGTKNKEYIQIGDLPPMTLSEAKLCRIMVRDIMGNAETKYDE
ncbi:uncharacterized protein LOC135708544 [Ochlerotatus camptorhynchus]|uniref:uncharacterized protein LOC135708544 n=1 Tax=Ochlerotatus camptorhynchus TaxID=644619 RepID=UPI0031DADFAB